jgi:hypothetical protein
MGFPNSIRIPATPGNRRYLKMLRKAEDVWWKSTGVQVQEGCSTPDTPPSSASNSGTEDWLMGVVAAISLAAVSCAITDSARLVQSWSGFVAWVRFAVGA